MSYPTEEIPPEDKLYRRIPNYYFKKGYIPTRAFHFDEDGCSVDWERYSDPEKTRNRVSDDGLDPSNFSVGSVINQNVLELGLNVQHNPQPNDVEPNRDNQTHTLIISNDPEDILDIQNSLANQCQYELGVNWTLKK